MVGYVSAPTSSTFSNLELVFVETRDLISGFFEPALDLLGGVTPPCPEGLLKHIPEWRQDKYKTPLVCIVCVSDDQGDRPPAGKTYRRTDCESRLTRAGGPSRLTASQQVGLTDAGIHLKGHASNLPPGPLFTCLNRDMRHPKHDGFFEIREGGDTKAFP